jgi:hypothetical protein
MKRSQLLIALVAVVAVAVVAALSGGGGGDSGGTRDSGPVAPKGSLRVSFAYSLRRLPTARGLSPRRWSLGH